MLIKEVKAYRIKDSRGKDTIEVSVNGVRASAPAGKSTGKFETPSYKNFIDWNIQFLNEFHTKLNINKFQDLEKLEKEIAKKSGVKDVKQFGANALFAFECAVLKALAVSKEKQLWEIINPKAKKLPIPVGNTIGGGVHSYNPRHPTFQEFLIIPKGKDFQENYKILMETYDKIGTLLGLNQINDEGAWECALSEEQILQLFLNFKQKINFGVDVAASSFFKNDKYEYRDTIRTRKEQIAFVNNLIEHFKPIYVEDPLEENDFNGFAKIHKHHMIVGDDLTVTHIDRLKKAIKSRSINAIIIKPNQNGSIVELQKIFNLCKKHKIKTILSHRSGETLDHAIADLAFGFQADYIKCGVATPFRQVKLHRLLEIESSL